MAKRKNISPIFRWRFPEAIVSIRPAAQLSAQGGNNHQSASDA
jgi:hypothetical protein